MLTSSQIADMLVIVAQNFTRVKCVTKADGADLDRHLSLRSTVHTRTGTVDIYEGGAEPHIPRWEIEVTRPWCSDE